MAFAIEEINNRMELLPGIKLGYLIHDSCASVLIAVHAAFQLSNGPDTVFHTGDNCSQSGMVMAIVGESSSTRSISMSRVIGSFNIPQVSHFATCACLSDKQQYPSFFRTIPSDQFQADALAKLVKHFGWTWIGAVRSDSDYGNNGMASFLDAAQKEGICVEYSESFYRTHPRSRIQRVADVIRRSTAMVVVAFAASTEMRILLEELSRESSPPRQWVGSESWVTNRDLLRFSFCAGAIGFGIQQSVIPGLKEFLLDLSPSKVSASSLLTEFWEDAFNCRLGKSVAIDDSVCDGSEDIQMLQNLYTDTSQLRVTNMVYKAVYAIAHAIHNAVCQGTNSTLPCNKFSRIDPKQVLTQLKRVNFSQNGYDVSFDTNGDPVATYELVNWQKSEGGSLELVTVGHYDASLLAGQEFHINRNLTWVEGGTQVPVSVCSDSCCPGTRKVLQKGKPICCYDCIPCPEGEISNATDSTDCFPCHKEFWPNAQRDTCFPKPIEFLSFDEVLGIILAAFSVGGACLAITTAAVFFRHRTSPIVRANNSELSFLLLFSLTLCFLCSLTFIGAPSDWSCKLRHTAFGITFVLCISCVLGKTIVVLMAFKATLPGSNVMKWFGPPQQRMTVVSFTLIQVLICTIWLVINPPFPMKNLTIYKERIILECALGSAIGFWAVLGYIGLLAVFCLVLAFLARKLPDNFNEAKLITFSMLIFCAVWITFIPAYVSSPGKFTVAVEIFAILASSFGLILCIFAPKCFIILFKPEKNTKKHLMNKNDLKQRVGLGEEKTAAEGSTEASSVKCRLMGTTRIPAFSMDGDYVIGGVFSIHDFKQTVKHNYTTMPEPLKCTGSIDSRELRFSRAMVFAIEEINNSTELLPGIKLGYQIHDSCTSVPVAMHVTLQLSNGLDLVFYTGEKCSQSGMVMAIIGESGSTRSISMSRIIGSFDIPQVSYFATCACLSDKQQYPSFFRTIPSDQFQAAALAKLVKHFGWTWIGAVRSDSDYGNNGMASFLEAAQKEGICVEYSESFHRTHPRSRIQRVAEVIRRSTATVVLAFVASTELRILLEELSHEPSPPRQWIGSESWVTDRDMLRFSFCAGAIGFGIQESVIPGFREFLLDLSPTKVAASPVLTELWEDAFNCKLGKTVDKSVCDGTEDIQTVQSPYTDTSQLRITNMVYKAVYAVAHAIHNVVCQDTNSTTHCDKFTRTEPKWVLTQLKKIHFSQNGYDVSFDANGDPVAKYELVNWQKSESGSIELVTVGHYDASLPVGQEFRINRNLTWVEGGTKVPVSVCSDRCPPGTRKVLQKGKPICCYDCIPCPDGEISNATDSTDCFPCHKEFWPNAERDTCLPKPVEFLSFDEVLGIILAAFSVGGACLAITTAAVFFQHRTSPIVRANNSELSFLLLFSLTLCFLCSLTFIGAPSDWSCMLRHTAFGITFVLCISCVLGKTIVVLMAFKATLPGSNVMKWFGPPQQRMTVVSFTFIQVLICTVWLIINPPFPMKNLTIYKERIILECALGSAIGFWAVLGYIGLLAVFCFVLAVLARKLPDNFNEAKLITFSMLIFCAVWITFIPAYVSSPGKFTVAVEIFAILASSFGLILCIFAPKCFLILFKPEKNTKKHLMNKNQS
ncbi:vomeronasal type-2 receptor 1-like [Symphorus nematophorus]